MSVQILASGGSLVQQAMDAVTGHIRAGGLKVGDTLPGEGYFAETLGVSRAVMREAFGALAALRLIDVGNGRRPRVGAIDGAVFAASLEHGVSTAQISVADVWEVRRTIELRTATLAAENRSDADAAHLLDLVERMAREVEGGAPTDHDIAFHTTIARASGNPLFVQIVTSFETLMRVAVPKAWETRRTEEERQAIIYRHWALARAIAEQRPSDAAAEMAAHFDASVEAQLRQLPR